MKIKNKWIKVTGIALAIIFAASVTVIAASVNIQDKNSESKEAEEVNIDDIIQSKADEAQAESLAQAYGKDKLELLELKSKLGSWEEVFQKLFDEKNRLTQDKVLELYDQGYSLLDIEKAQELATMSDKTAIQIIEAKGKKDKEGKSKKWDDVVNELQIDTRKPAEKLGIPKDKIAELEKQGMSEREIIDVGLLSSNYNKDYNTVLKELEKGKTKDALEKQYKSEAENDPKKDEELNKALKKSEEMQEKYVKDKYKMTDEEIKKCKDNGINGFEIATVKKMADNNKTTIDKVIETKKKKGDWDAVSKELGGAKK